MLGFGLRRGVGMPYRMRGDREGGGSEERVLERDGAEESDLRSRRRSNRTTFLI